MHWDKPYLYTEKMQWAKLYDDNELKTVYADKYLVIERISNKIGKE